MSTVILKVKKTSDNLEHAGIKGMRWGVRRYQNEDGTLTEAGKKRYGGTSGVASSQKREPPKFGSSGPINPGHREPPKFGSSGPINPGPHKKREISKEDLEAGRRLVNETKQLTKALKEANDNVSQKSPKPKMDLKNMSDKDMRDKINRELLERQYNDVFNPPKTSKGRQIVSATLDTAGTVLSVGASALGIALAIKELKKVKS